MTPTVDLTSAPWQSLDPGVLAPADPVPTMLRAEERKMYFWLAQHMAREDAAIVDLGAYVGGSTACLAAGVEHANGTAQIHAYDRFNIQNPDRKERLIRQGVPPFEGSDAIPAIQTLLDPWRDKIHLHPGDIREKGWNSGPISLLIIDAAKHADTGDHIAQTFFPHLVPGRSLVVHQDFLNPRQPWIAAQMAMFSGYFEPVALCESECMLFRHTVPIPAGALARAKIDTMTASAYLTALRDISAQLEPMVGARPLRRIRKTAKTFPNIRNAHKLTRAMRRADS